MNNLSNRSIIFTTVIVMLMVSPEPSLAQRGANPAPPAAPPCVISSRQLTLVNLISLLQDKTVAFTCIEERISKQGVSFERTPLVEQTLSGFNASARIIAMIPLPPPPIPVIPKVAGPLSVTCAAPECEVYIGGRYEKTVGGKAIINGLSPGRVPLVVYREGFIMDSREIALIDGQAQTVAVELRPIPPDPSLPQLKLKASLWDMIVAAGRIEQIDGKGTLSWTVGDKKQQWDVTRFAKNAGKDLDITFKNAAGECKLKITGQVAKPLTCPKLKGDPKVDVVAAAILFLNYQVHDVLNVISKRELIRSQGNTNRLETVGGPDSYTLTLNAEGLPTELNHEVQGKDWTVQYLDYKTFATGCYPTRMVIEEASIDGTWEFGMTVVQPR